MNWSQVSGAVDRVVLIGLTWLASKGYIPIGEVANYAALVVGIIGTFYAFYVNRNANLAKQAASIPGTIVVTDKSIASATPDHDNIVAKEDVKVINK